MYHAKRDDFIPSFGRFLVAARTELAQGQRHPQFSIFHSQFSSLVPSGSVNNSLSGVSVLISLTVTLRVSVSPS